MVPVDGGVLKDSLRGKDSEQVLVNKEVCIAMEGTFAKYQNNIVLNFLFVLKTDKKSFVRQKVKVKVNE